MTRSPVAIWESLRYLVQHVVHVLVDKVQMLFDHGMESELKDALERFSEESFYIAVHVCKDYALLSLPPSARLVVSRKEIVVVEEDRALSSFFTLRFVPGVHGDVRVQESVILRVIADTTKDFPGFDAVYDSQQYVVQCWYR